jgi:hypothetical protein
MLDSNSNAGCQKIITGLTCGADRVLIGKKNSSRKAGRNNNYPFKGYNN